jgi:hypothetical protein
MVVYSIMEQRFIFRKKKKKKWRRIPLTPTRKLAFFICLFKMILYPFPIRILRDL